jgi:hypothetical protein
MSQHRDRNESSRSSEMPAPMAVGIFVIIIWVALGFFIPSVGAAGEYVFESAFLGVLDAGTGVWQGFGLGAQAISNLLTFEVPLPLLWSTAAGILAGIFVAWTHTALGVRERSFSPVVKALFTAEPISKAGLQLLWLAFADIIAGYAVILAFGAIGLIATSLGGGPHHLHDAVATIWGAGGGPHGGADDLIFVAFLLVLAALIVIGAVVGAAIGGALGSLSGMALGLFNIHYAVHGATEGATLNLLLGRTEAIKAGGIGGFLTYVIFGALNGVAEGITVGALVGIIVTCLHAFFGI